jgi:DNA (cytosine-5)-methyltransferase 1
MFPYAIKAIEKLSPKAFVFENVKGLLRASFREYFEYILLRLTYPELESQKNNWREHLKLLRALDPSSYQGVRYKVKYRLLNAADYGVPQCRERVVIVGIRSDITNEFYFPEPTHSEDRLIWDKFVTGEYWIRHEIPKKDREEPSLCTRNKIKSVNARFGLWEPNLLPWVTIRDALQSVPDPRKKHNIPDHIFRGGAKEYAGHTGSEIDWPAKTIKAGGHGVPGGENMLKHPNGTIRYFTTYEAKLIQTFPPDYVIKGSWGEALRQIGNAVPVLLAQRIGIDLMETLTKTKKRRGDKAVSSGFDKKQERMHASAY